jgi:membrane-bound metal-dependent hydrolase YbcI (DUF457 family)
MTWKTHMIGGAQAGIIAACMAGTDAIGTGVLISSAVLGSVLPDIDQPGSRIARSDSLTGLVSHAVASLTKHRGFTHTLPGAALMALAFYALAMFRTEEESLTAFFAAAAVFILLHLAGGIFSRLAGWTAALAYTAGPQIAQALSQHSVHFSPDEHSARLCAVGIFAGCISHIAYDAFNKGGVMLLYPLSRKTFRLLNIKTNTPGEFFFAAAQVMVLSVILAFCWQKMDLPGTINGFLGSISI